MLSYNTPVAVGGPAPSSPTNISTARQAVSSSAPQNRLPLPAMVDAVANAAVSTAATLNLQRAPAPVDHHIWLVTGPAGCGKSTIAKYLSDTLDLPYVEGDEFHPPANIEKMSNGIPLTDADRWDWLTALRQESIRQLDAGSHGVVLTCSALKRKYRDVIRVAPYFSPNLHLHFIYLHASEEVLLSRVLARQVATNHYMGANMVHSQFDILEPPAMDEVDVISIDVAHPPEVVKAIALRNALAKMDETTSMS